jgi:hypothetical protein
MRNRLVSLVLALYPASLRARYGAEIAHLLEHSRKPLRDLADVTRSALAERLSHVAVTAYGAAGPVAARLALPVVAALAVAAPVALFTTVPLATIAVGVFAGLLLARPRSAVAVSGAVLLLYAAPHLVQLLAGRVERVAEMGSTLAFAGVLAALTLVVARGVRRRRWLAATVATVAGLALPQLATMALVWLSGGATGAPWTWYWIAMLPNSPWRSGFSEDLLFTVDDIVAWYPALFTLCASLVLASVCGPRRRPVGGAGG